MSTTRVIKAGLTGASAGKPTKITRLAIPSKGSVNIRSTDNGGFIVEVYDPSEKNEWRPTRYAFSSRSEFEVV